MFDYVLRKFVDSKELIVPYAKKPLQLQLSCMFSQCQQRK